MLGVSDSLTRATLLGKLRTVPDDPLAWAEFVQSYEQKIFAWCCAWGLQDADSHDVTQIVFLNLTTRLRDFQYDSSGCFRAWLKTVTHHAWQDYIRKLRRDSGGTLVAAPSDRLATLEARDDLSKRILELIDEEVLNEASLRVRLRVEPRTWEAFKLTAVDGLSGMAVAQRLGMKVATVFVAKSNVQRMLTEEVKRIESSAD